MCIHISASESRRCLLLVCVCVNRLQPAFSLSFSWVIGYAAHGTRDLQATQRKGNTGMEETEITEACQTFFFFSSSLHSVTPSCCLLINFVLSLSSNTPCASQPSLRVFLYFFGFQNIHLEPCRSFLHLSCLSFNFPPHSHSYSVCECTRISIRPLETPVQFPGRL